MLPQEFTKRMEAMLGDAYAAFIESYDGEPVKALRLNPLKVKEKEFLQQTNFSLQKVPWAEYGYYCTKEEEAGKHPYHEAGVYYMQEASAMAPAEYIEAKPNERILDLCAAPGGKSTQMAAKMQGKGVFVCNEIHPARAKILSENIERMGIRNAIVTNESPQKLSAHFAEYFDKILVDAPCSGEGMFRKNKEACKEWSLSNVKLCADRQDEILDCAAGMLRGGGRLVYSTCTFAPEENEGSISRFLKRHPEFFIVKAEKKEGMDDGNSAWVEAAAENLEDTIRLFPHRLKGEGHYAAVLQKMGEASGRVFAKGGEEKGILEKDCKEWLQFKEENLVMDFTGVYTAFKDQLYLLPQGAPALKGLKVLRAGLHLGTKKKNRFEPSHALALASAAEEVRHSLCLKSTENDIASYLNGQTISAEGEKGWYLVTVDGYSIGWGKLVGGILKNHYPKGLRKNF